MLNSFFKKTISKIRFRKLLPRSLFARFLLIITIPTLLVQLVSIYVFYYMHIDNISKHMARSIIAEMEFIKKTSGDPDYKDLVKKLASDVDIRFSLENKRFFSKRYKIADSAWQRNKFFKYINPLPIIDPLNRFKQELEAAKLTPFVIYKDDIDDSRIFIRIKNYDRTITFSIPIKRVTNSSKYIFTLWMFITAIVTSIISIIFLKNQIRSIKQLTYAAEKFGRGGDVVNFKPNGAKEIRSAGISFIKMKERIIRQISNRTDMLSSVSHDLRTPLTRMKLGLELMPQSPEVEDLKHDVNDMEKLIDEYLNFAKGDDKEKPKKVKMKNFLEEKIIKYYHKINKKIGSSINIENDFEMPIRSLALKRALLNLIDNGFNYGSKVLLNASINNNNLIITIDDDGPGIPDAEKENVFKPFYRIDNSRNLDKTGGSGLGLAIAMSGIAAHGGRIKLSQSQLIGGLRVIIYLPVSKSF
jgi:two-component system osmolarity sensor histidine kinase EnvZ